MRYLSTAGHVKPCRNLGRPRSKAKYYLATDSEQVPWGKGEKNPGEGSEIEPETINEQDVIARKGGGVPFVEWACELRYAARLRNSSSGAEGKPSLNRANKLHDVDPKPRWSSHEQVEARVKPCGGPNYNLLKKVWMTCDSEWKAKQTWK